MSGSQRRCVFVGNIPYDATEDQLVRIFEEVGPVVSFRLVLDRETGRAKGYGFCEFRDEETALSARRNLQGYEINGRQLRVDFAENEKGSMDRQGRGGPGMPQGMPQPAANPQFTEVPKQPSLQVPARERPVDEPTELGVPALAHPSVTGMLTTSQMSMPVSQGNTSDASQPNGNQVNGTAVATDVLTNHLAGMSKHQLYQIVSQVKDLIQQNQQQAREILIGNPQLTKALFQAQIMLGMVRAPEPAPLRDGPLQQLPPQQMHVQPTAAQPPQYQNIPQLMTKQVPPQPGQTIETTGQLRPQAPASAQQSSLPVQPQHQQFQAPMQQQHQQPELARSSPMFAQPQGVPSLQAQNPVIQHAQAPPPPQPQPPPLPQQPRPLAPTAQLQPQNTQGMGYPSIHGGPQPYLTQPPFPQQSGVQQGNVGFPLQQMHPPNLAGHPPPQQVYQMPRNGGDLASAAIGQGPMMGMGGPVQGGRAPSLGIPSASAPMMTWNQPIVSSGFGGAHQPITGHMVPGHHGGGNTIPSSLSGGPLNSGVPLPGNMGPGLMYSQQGYSQPLSLPQPPQQQPQMPIELEQQKALLQQVMNLTTEQINSLPPEQRQQVFQLQQAFRGQTA